MTHGHFPGCLRLSFAEVKKPAIYIFSRNLHLLSFPTIYSLPCFPLKWRAYKFFPWGHLRRSGVTLNEIKKLKSRNRKDYQERQCLRVNKNCPFIIAVFSPQFYKTKTSFPKKAQPDDFYVDATQVNHPTSLVLTDVEGLSSLVFKAPFLLWSGSFSGAPASRATPDDSGNSYKSEKFITTIGRS